MEPNISVIIPWREAKSRKYAFDLVKSWYQKNLPQATIIEVDDGRVPFCLSGTRNLGVKQAEEAGSDVVVISDADTIPEIDALNSAIEEALINDTVVLPYTKYHSLQKWGTKQYIEGAPPQNCHAFIVEGACSGVYVCRPRAWWKHYGQDERFRGWGFEDAAWYVAHTTLIGNEPKRVEGRVFAFTHQSEIKEGKNYNNNAELCARYLSLEGNVEEMKNLASDGLFLDW